MKINKIKIPEIKYLESDPLNLGCDPELFIINKKNGEALTADNVLPPKSKKLNTSEGYGKVFFDGAQAEINPQQSTCRESLLSNMFECLNTIKSRTGVMFCLSDKASVKFTKKALQEADKECRRFGCDPDYNIYKRSRNSISLDGSRHLLRYAGGHIHIGSKAKICKDRRGVIDLVKVLDRIVGIPATLIDTDNNSRLRRKYYGKAGDYRIQKWGIEYRTLSNFWLRSPQLTSLFLGLTRTAFTLTNHGYAKMIINLTSDNDIRKAINSSDVKLAREIFNKIIQIIVQVDSPLSSPDDLARFEYLAKNGIDSVFKDMETEWSLDGISCSDDFDNCAGWQEGMYQKIPSNKLDKLKVINEKYKFKNY